MSTIRTRTDALAALAVYCGDLLAADLTAIRAVLDSREFCASTRNLWRSHLSAFYRWAIEEELTEKNPTRRVPRVEQPDNLPRPISEPALADALATADERLAAWFTLGAYAGLRISEISALRGDNIDTASRTLRVVMGKRRKTRIVPLHPRAAAAVEPFATSGRLWPNPPKVVGMYISGHLRSLGYADTAHSLRHRFATSVYETSGGDINLVRELLGHASTATTQVYARVSVTRMQSAVALIA